MNKHLLGNAKAYASLTGAVSTALLAVYVDNPILTTVSVVATAIVTWTVPNTDEVD